MVRLIGQYNQTFVLLSGGHDFECASTSTGAVINLRRLNRLSIDKPYTMTLQQESDIVKPVRYEMFGYDSLIGSHYDKYYIDYLNFHTDNFSDTEFDPPKGMGL